MRGIAITESVASSIILILNEECDARIDERGAHAFSHHITRDCAEYRFMGALGFGGKFRNNGNHDNTPYVDCYPEDLTPERKARIERANARLAKLFRVKDSTPRKE